MSVVDNYKNVCDGSISESDFFPALLLRLALNNLEGATARTVFIPAKVFVIVFHSLFSSSLNRFVCICLGMILRHKMWSNCCKLLLFISVNHCLFCLLCVFFFLFLLCISLFTKNDHYRISKTRICLYLWTVSTECVVKQKFYQNTFRIMPSLSWM